jgi:hypothetical protein
MRALIDEGLPAATPWVQGGVEALKQLTRRGITARPPHRNGRRFLILHLDGVSRSRLERGVAEGTLPNLRALLAGGGYALSPLYAGSPSSTPAFQAGLMWGVKADVPGFLWFDKRLGRNVRMDQKIDATRVEDEIAHGRRGLLEDGTSYFSIFSGGSAINGFCLTGWGRDVVKLHAGANAWDALGLAGLHALTAARVGTGAVVESVVSVADVLGWAARTGRLDHERDFFKNRILLAAGAREYATTATVLDVVRGVPSIYTCYADYDEISHRRGPDSPEAMRALEATDRSVGALLRAVKAADNGYDIYLLADHGQVATRPFEQVTGSTLKDFVTHRGASAPYRGPEGGTLGWARNLASAAWRAATGPTHTASPMQDALLGAMKQAHGKIEDEVVVVDAGDVAHVYFLADREPMTREAIERRYPGVLAALTGSGAAGVVAVRGGRAGYAYRKGAEVDLAGSDSELLKLGYGEKRVQSAIRGMLTMRSSGDIVVYGNGVEGTDIAYAWEFGSHGGIAQEEVEAFMIHPAGTPYDFAQVEHASDLYRFFTSHYGIDTGAPR